MRGFFASLRIAQAVAEVFVAQFAVKSDGETVRFVAEAGADEESLGVPWKKQGMGNREWKGEVRARALETVRSEQGCELRGERLEMRA